MIIDRLLRFSSGQDLSQVANDYASTDVIDFGIGTSAAPAIPSNANGGGARDMGIGDDPALKFVVIVQEAFASATSAATLQITLQGAPDDGTGVPGAYVSWWASPLYTVAQLTLGARLLDIDFPRPPQGAPVPRFVRLLYTIASETTTAGTVFAALVLDRLDQMYNGTDNAVLGGYRPGVVVQN
jgi:hypothetical protein